MDRTCSFLTFGAVKGEPFIHHAKPHVHSPQPFVHLAFKTVHFRYEFTAIGFQLGVDTEQLAVQFAFKIVDLGVYGIDSCVDTVYPGVKFGLDRVVFHVDL